MKPHPSLVAFAAAMAVGFPRDAAVAQSPPAAGGDANVLITGALVDSRGRPVEGARLLPDSGTPWTTEQILTAGIGGSDAEGVLRVAMPAAAGLPTHGFLAARGTTSVRVALRWREVKSGGGRGWSADLGAVALRRGTVVRGLVRDEAGRPVVGARVVATDVFRAPHIQRDTPEECVAAGETDRRGRFAVHGVPITGASLVIRASGRRREDVAFANQFSPVVVTLKPAGRVHGVVVGPDGKGRRGWVSVLYGAGQGSNEARLGPGGSFALPLLHPGRFRLEYRAASGGGAVLDEIRTPAETPVRFVASEPAARPAPAHVFRIRSQGPVVGTLTGKLEGVPIPAGWQVGLAPLRSVEFLPISQDPPALPALRARVAPDGSYRLPFFQTGRTQLTLVICYELGYLQVPLQIVNLRPGPQKTRSRLQRFLPGTLRGRVVANGAPLTPGRLLLIARPKIENANRVQVFTPFADPQTRGVCALVRPDGTYSMPLLPGENTLRVFDLATGVMLHVESNPVLIKPSQQQTRDLKVRLGLVQVELQRGAAPPDPVRFLEVVDKPGRRTVRVAGRWLPPEMAFVGDRANPRSRGFSLIVPLRPIWLQARTLGHQLYPSKRRFQFPVRGEAEVEADFGAVTRLVLRLR